MRLEACQHPRLHLGLLNSPLSLQEMADVHQHPLSQMRHSCRLWSLLTVARSSLLVTKSDPWIMHQISENDTLTSAHTQACMQLGES